MAGNVFPLDAPVYQMNEAARLLGLPDKTLRRWIDGDRRFDRVVEPLIRPLTTGDTDVTWGEFVEAGLLAQYRVRRLPLEKLRPLIAGLREELGTPYPLAEGRPLHSDGRELLWRVQKQQGIDADLFLVVNTVSTGYQLALSEVATHFASRVEFEPPRIGVVTRWYPGKLNGRRIVLDPRVAFGIPTISGVRTEVIAEFAAAGESIAVIQASYASYGLTVSDVEEAIRFESSLYSKAA